MAYCDEYFFNTKWWGKEKMHIPDSNSLCSLFWMAIFKPPLFCSFLIVFATIALIAASAEHVCNWLWEEIPTFRSMVVKLNNKLCKKVEIE